MNSSRFSSSKQDLELVPARFDRSNNKLQGSELNRRQKSSSSILDPRRFLSKDSIASSNQARIFALEAQKVPEEQLVYRNIGFKDIMSEYKPKWLAGIGLIASFGASL
jgi:hypothetical protein